MQSGKKLGKEAPVSQGKTKLVNQKKEMESKKIIVKITRKKYTKKNKPFFATHSLFVLSSVLLALAFTFKAAYHEGNFQTCSPRTYLVKLNH